MAIPVKDDGTELVQKVAKDLGLILANHPEGYYLVHEQGQWVVCDSGKKENFKIKVDFEVEWRRLVQQKINPKKDLLCRALGFRGQSSFKVIDGTFGMGRDATHLYSFGIKIVGVEKNPIAYLLTSSALDKVKQWSLNFSVTHGDIAEKLESLARDADGLYLDPMFENLNKKSLPKKNLAFLRALQPDNPDVQRVIPCALDLGVKRVVVKRPIKASQLYENPRAVYRGKLIRYDVYMR